MNEFDSIPEETIPVTDTHAHLDSYNIDKFSEVLTSAHEAGIRYIINLSASIESLETIPKMQGGPVHLYHTIGVHPHEAKELRKKETLDKLKTMLKAGTKDSNLAAVGETGLDYHYMLSEKEDQIYGLETQIELANEHELPIVLHCRDAYDDMFQILNKHPDTKGVFHCFSQDEETAVEVLKRGFYLSYSGIVTFPKARNVFDAMMATPFSKLMVETDAPYLAPVPYRGKQNQPAYIKNTIEFIAKERAVTPEDIIRINAGNAERVFKKDFGWIDTPKVAYEQGNTCYLNISNRCPIKCSFCFKHKVDGVYGHNLMIQEEPSFEETIREIEAIRKNRRITDIAFVGFGDALMRADLVTKIAGHYRNEGLTTRLDTSGHFIPDEAIKSAISNLDRITISLNTHDENQYNKLCPSLTNGSFKTVVDFINFAKGYVQNTEISVVDFPDADHDSSRRIAEDLGINLRIRGYRR